MPRNIRRLRQLRGRQRTGAPIPPPAEKRHRKLLLAIGTGIVTLILVPTIVGVTTNVINKDLEPSLKGTSPSATPSTAGPLRTSVNAITDRDEANLPTATPTGWLGNSRDLAVLAVHVVDNVCNGAPGWRVPGPLGPPPPPDGSVREWAKTHGGAEASGTEVQFTLQGLSDTAITVTDLRIAVTGKATPKSGSYVNSYGECGGVEDRSLYGARLDDSPPQVFLGSFDDASNGASHFVMDTRKRFNARAYTVTKSDPESFILYAYAKNYDYSWQAIIDWTSADARQHVTVVNDESGQPFTTVPRPSRAPVVNRPNFPSTDSATWAPGNSSPDSL